jgi:hypothetical protein
VRKTRTITYEKSAAVKNFLSDFSMGIRAVVKNSRHISASNAHALRKG